MPYFKQYSPFTQKRKEKAFYMGLLTKIFGNYSEKEIKRIIPIKDKVLELESKYSPMTDSELKAQTPALKERLENGETLDDILPDAFAVCREAMWRVLGIKPYPVQILGGIILFQGRIAEMRTGEGKTFVAALPSYLVALSGKGVHVVTVNDYLAKRDGEMIGRVHRFLGLTVGLILHDMKNDERRKSYNSDVTYGTNNEFGFDYLRDNMCNYKKDKVQREFNFAIVDEVDSILIDEARTPLIISGPGDKSTDLYQKANRLALQLKPFTVIDLDSKEDQDQFDGDYIIDEKAKNATLTQRGVKKAEAYFGVENLMDAENMTLLHHVNQAIKAVGVMKRDVDYVVKDGEIVIVDEFTGRLMFGRRFNEGLHQAIEAKEGVKVKNESKTLATITFQNFFRLYDKLSGMTGTAMTEEAEFRQIYALDVIEIPTNKPIARIDHEDQVYKNEEGKYKAVIRQIEECHAKGQPVLVGTITIEKSELLSSMLKKKGIKHEVLNAKNHEREAEIVAQAGKKGAVTIATNMAGRGTDIMLGGNAEYLAKARMRKEGMDEALINEATGFAETDNEDILNARETYIKYNAEYKAAIKDEAEEVRQAGGLFILGTERHESRRIDNQLRGRAGRQGDPGSSCFYLSMEDQLLRIFGGDRMRAIADRLKLEPGVAIESKMLTRMIESAQRKVEGRNYDIRKQLLEFDDVQNDQRHEIYGLRNEILEATDCSELIKNLREGYFTDLFRSFVPADTVEEQWDLDALNDKLKSGFGIEIDFKKMLDADTATTDEDLLKALIDRANEIYEAKETLVGHDAFAAFGRSVLLQVIDQLWRQHIAALDALRQGIYLRGYAQKQPKQEYKREAFTMFEQLLDSIRETTTTVLMRVEIKQPEEAQAAAQDNLARGEARADASHLADADASQGLNAPNDQGSSLDQLSADENARLQAAFRHCGRNDPCPCGSGKKFKDCHGRLR